MDRNINKIEKNCDHFSYEVKISQTGHQVPVVNGIHLHSIYDPIIEAEKIVQNFTSSLQKKNTVLILGMGFGYHVIEIIKQFKIIYQNNFTICVIEPLKNIVDDYQQLYPKNADQEKVLIFQSNDPSELYNNKEFLEFLMTKPSIFYHPSSFNLHKEYFKNFMSFKASPEIGKIANQLTCDTLKNYLMNYPENLVIEDILNEIKNDSKRELKEIDFLLFAYGQI